MTRTTAALNNTDQPPFDLAVTDGSSFPASGQILVSDGAWNDGTKAGAEIMTYDSKTATSFHITQRGPQKVASSVKQAHPANSLVKLATTLTAGITPADGPQTTLTAFVSRLTGGCVQDPGPGAIHANCPGNGSGIAPFPITLASTAGFPASGAISISHQDVQTSNVGGQIGEYMAYQNPGPCSPAPAANQLCIVARAQQPANRAYDHKATGYPQPGQVPLVAGTPGASKVSLHFQLNVKSNAGFFPAGPLLICDATNPLGNCELVDHNNAAGKIKVPSATELHITERGVPANTYNKTPISTHAADSVVTGADAFVACRARFNQPGVDTDLATVGLQEPAAQTPGTSVGIGAVCYTGVQPGTVSSPTCCPPGGGDIAGQELILRGVLALGTYSVPAQLFLSTGGFCHVVLGAVGTGPSSCPGTLPAPFDTNGPNDGSLVLASPCISDFTPGTNLLINVTLNQDKVLENTDSGTIRVVLDTVHDATPGNGDECDEPAGTDSFTSTTYDAPTYPYSEDADDDTDRDGCLDARELQYLRTSGGLRDPWNPYDYYDIDHNGAVGVVVDLLQVAAAFGAGDPDYRPRKDRGTLNYGPFLQNKSAPNGSVDVVNDILGVASQFGDPCPHNHALYTGANAPWYGAGVVPGH